MQRNLKHAFKKFLYHHIILFLLFSNCYYGSISSTFNFDLDRQKVLSNIYYTIQRMYEYMHTDACNLWIRNA